MRKPIALEQRVAITIWKLATNVEYRTLSELFGLGKATDEKIVVKTCQIIYSQSMYIFLKETS